MSPDKVSHALRFVASEIDKFPSRKFATHALRSIISSIQGTYPFGHGSVLEQHGSRFTVKTRNPNQAELDFEAKFHKPLTGKWEKNGETSTMQINDPFDGLLEMLTEHGE